MLKLYKVVAEALNSKTGGSQWVVCLCSSKWSGERYVSEIRSLLKPQHLLGSLLGELLRQTHSARI